MGERPNTCPLATSEDDPNLDACDTLEATFHEEDKMMMMMTQKKMALAQELLTLPLLPPCQ